MHVTSMMKDGSHVGFSSDWSIIVPVTSMNFGIKKIINFRRICSNKHVEDTI
jgi:hypothetical protein